MSGGALNYLCQKVEIGAEEVLGYARTPQQKALGMHLKLVAKALHEVEWVFSGDCAPGSEAEINAIEAVVSKQLVLQTIVNEAKQINQELTKLLSELETSNDTIF